MKQFALIAGILAAAFTQIKNVLSDEPEAPPPGKPPAGKPAAGKAAPAAEPENEEDDLTGPTLGGEAEVDYDALRESAKLMVTKLLEVKPAIKPKIRELLLAAGDAKKIGVISDEYLEAFVAGVRKLGGK